jgi:hypothetical protein
MSPSAAAPASAAFGFSVVSEDKPLEIIRLGTTRMLVSLNRQSPAGIVDHFSLGAPRFTKESAARYLTQHGARPLDDPYAGLHGKDLDGSTCRSLLRGDQSSPRDVSTQPDWFRNGQWPSPRR